MPLDDKVRVSRRFQRAIRIDRDLNESDALKGFICPQSSADILLATAKHVSRTGQGAFTWTGPYGSGKSSLVIAMSALLEGDEKKRKIATKAVGEDTATNLLKALPPGNTGWNILPVVGRRADPVAVIGEAMEDFNIADLSNDKEWTEKNIVEILFNLATSPQNASGGLIIFIDEMGKFLEAAAHDGFDVYLFQQLAEASARSKGRLLVIGILHQAFEEYAHRLSREMRDEWSKIQGRFIDLAVNTAGEEQIDLLSRAIETPRLAKSQGLVAKEVADFVKKQRPGASAQLAKILEDCWPLHPIVAALLGPISKRRFGQNQRSIFGFLNSAEPQGFQDFLVYAEDDDIYSPYKLWDYLRLNLEPSILASPDGHRWAMATEAVDRCEANGGSELHLRLLKTIALIDIFRERSGLLPTLELLRVALPEFQGEDINNALQILKEWSLIIFRRHLNAYAIFAGSDFDIEEAISTALEEIDTVDFQNLKALANLQPILAKRHYHETGSLRWFEADITSLSEVVNVAAQYQGEGGTIGKFLLAIPTSNEDGGAAQTKCREAAKKAQAKEIIVGLSPRAWTITDLSRELIALEYVQNERPELRGDAVARREVQARFASLQGQLEQELLNAFDNATWYLKHRQPEQFSRTELNILASEIARYRFPSAPRIHNELLNRAKPSKNAVAAQNILLRRMVYNAGEERLGIEGYPAEGGLFDSLLYAPGLYRETEYGRRFMPPDVKKDSCNLKPLWDVASHFLQENSDRCVSMKEIYELWIQPPYGVKEGLLPTLGVAFFLSQREGLAFYREGVFSAHFTDLDIDYLVKDPSTIQLRWVNLSIVSRRLLSDLTYVARELGKDNELAGIEPIEVARGLIAIYESLPSWVKRTMKLSSNAIKIRNLFKRANDPNKFLFDDLPTIFGEETDLSEERNVQKIVARVREGLKELLEVYPTTLRRLKNTLLSELQVPNNSDQAMAELRERAENIKQVAGDFRLDAFISRLTAFEGTEQNMEGIISLATNKPPRDWVDPDIDKAAIEITDMAQKFLRIETFAHVKGRINKRHSMAVVIGGKGTSKPILQEFDIADRDYPTVKNLANNIEKELRASEIINPNIVLATLSELITRFIPKNSSDGDATN